jgi:spore germination cell wall hydrolase CwlJ-like protein
MWHIVAALVPLPLIGLGYVAAVPGNRVAFQIELFLAGNGSVHAFHTTLNDAAEPYQPLPREAAQLFKSAGKGPRADRYLIVKTTTYAGKQFLAANVIGMPEVTGSLSKGNGGLIRDKKGDRLNPPVTEVALRGSADNNLSTALFMTALPKFDQAFDFGGTPPSQEAIAYHPSGQGLAFKSKGESQAEFEERERRCLATAIYFEARGEPVRGQIAVGQVILNRVRSPQFPETICGVVYQGQMQKGCQFSFACDGHTDLPRDNDQWALAQDLSRQITSGQVWLPEVGYSTFYHANYVSPSWVSAMSKIDSIGRHIFYKKRNEIPYVVQDVASATPSATAVTPAMSLASSAPGDGSIAATPALSLGPSPSE